MTPISRCYRIAMRGSRCETFASERRSYRFESSKRDPVTAEPREIPRLRHVASREQLTFLSCQNITAPVRTLSESKEYGPTSLSQLIDYFVASAERYISTVSK